MWFVLLFYAAGQRGPSCHYVVDRPAHEVVLYELCSDLFNMERGEFCHDQYMLVDYIQDVGEVHARVRCAAPVLKRVPHNWIFCKIRSLFFDITRYLNFFLLRFRIVRHSLEYMV